MVNTELFVVGAKQSAQLEVSVNTKWVAQYLNNSNVCISEANWDVLLCETLRVPDGQKFNWHSDMRGSPDGACPERIVGIDYTGRS